MNRTKIEWAKNPDGTQGFTWNPITGCLNGCEYCYARRLANTRLRGRYLANTTLAGGYCLAQGALNENAIPPKLNPFYPRFWEDRLAELDNFAAINEPNFLRRLPRKARGIFVCDMSDLFGIGVPESWTREVLASIYHADMHRFYLLTKQPQNLIKFSPFPDNVWLGVSATDYGMGFRGTDYLRQIEAGKTFVSFEPLLSQVLKSESDKKYMLSNLDWVIIGAQTKPYRPPRIEWVQEIETVARNAGMAIFEKNNLKPLLKRDLIQEMPEGEWIES